MLDLESPETHLLSLLQGRGSLRAEGHPTCCPGSTARGSYSTSLSPRGGLCHKPSCGLWNCATSEQASNRRGWADDPPAWNRVGGQLVTPTTGFPASPSSRLGAGVVTQGSFGSGGFPALYVRCTDVAHAQPVLPRAAENDIFSSRGQPFEAVHPPGTVALGPRDSGSSSGNPFGNCVREGAEKTPSLMGPAREAQPPWIGLGPHRETLRVAVQFGEGSVDT